MPTLFYDQHEGLARAFLCEGARVRECFFDKFSRPQQTGAVLPATVTRILRHGAFVKFDDAREGFLNDTEGLQDGQRLLVQIKHEAREDKDVGLTRAISLPGVYFIHQPFGHGAHFSRRFAEEGKGYAENQILAMLEHEAGGWIIRRAASTAPKDALREEIKELRAAAQKLSHAPAPSAFEQAILGYAGEGGFEIVLEDDVRSEEVTRYLAFARPTLLNTLNVKSQKHACETHDLNGFFEVLRNTRVDMPQGGHLLFEATRTLFAIDVNAGGRGNYLEVNLDAAEIIMNHLRWRNIGGPVVIDFLRMKRPDDRRVVTELMEDRTFDDAQPCDIFGFTRMGLCELSRARRGYALNELL